MKYFKEIDIKNFDIIVSKSLDFVKSKPAIYNRDLHTASWYSINLEEILKFVPEIVPSFSEFNIIPTMIAAYVMYHPTNTNLHVDGWHAKARINLPLLNCNGTYTRFYTNVKTEKWINPTSKVLAYRVINDDYTFADEIEIKKATVLRTKEAHIVYMPELSPVPRITLTIGFNVDPVFLLE